MKKFFIYTLEDPISLKIRYIGLTSKKLSVRLSGHCASLEKSKSHKTNWIKKLIVQGRKPIIKELDIAYSLEEACELEIYWIDQFKQWGFDLTNATIGGEGVIGYKYDKEMYKVLAQKLSKPILQYDIKGNFIKKWNSILDAAKYFNCGSTAIRHALVDYKRTSNNFFWRYYEKDYPEKINVSVLSGNVIPLKVYDIVLDITTTYMSKQEAFATVGRPSNYSKYVNKDKYFKKRYKFMLC
jgi:hypothetical protein